MKFIPKKPVGKCYHSGGCTDLFTATDAQIEELYAANPALIESLFTIAKPAKNGKAIKESADIATGHETENLNSQSDDGYKVEH